MNVESPGERGSSAWPKKHEVARIFSLNQNTSLLQPVKSSGTVCDMNMMSKCTAKPIRRESLKI